MVGSPESLKKTGRGILDSMTLFVEKFPVAHIHVQNHSVAYALCALKKNKKRQKA